MNNFKLDNTPKINSGFVTPDKYFETFPDKILVRLSEPDKPVISLFRKRKFIYAAAAVLVLALSIPFMNKQFQDQDVVVDDATIENYLAYNADISQYQLLTLLESDDIQQLQKTYDLDEDILEDALAVEDLEQYITE